MTMAKLLLTSVGCLMISYLTTSFRADSNFVKSSNFDAPSASANNIVAPLALWMPCKKRKCTVA